MGRSLTSDTDLIGVTEMLVAALATLDAKGMTLTAIRLQHALDTLLTEAGGVSDPVLRRSAEDKPVSDKDAGLTL